MFSQRNPAGIQSIRKLFIGIDGLKSHMCGLVAVIAIPAVVQEHCRWCRRPGPHGVAAEPERGAAAGGAATSGGGAGSAALCAVTWPRGTRRGRSPFPLLCCLLAATNNSRQLSAGELAASGSHHGSSTNCSAARAAFSCNRDACCCHHRCGTLLLKPLRRGGAQPPHTRRPALQPKPGIPGLGLHVSRNKMFLKAAAGPYSASSMP